MKPSSRTSQRPANSTRRVVKNKVQIGDSKFAGTVKPDARGAYSTVNAGNQKFQQYYADNTKQKRLGRVDRSGYNKEVRAKGPRAAQVYGSRKAALKASYRNDRTTGQRIPGSEYKPKKKRTADTVKAAPKRTRTSQGIGTMANPIIGRDGRSARSKSTLI